MISCNISTTREPGSPETTTYCKTTMSMLWGKFQSLFHNNLSKFKKKTVFFKILIRLFNDDESTQWTVTLLKIVYGWRSVWSVCWWSLRPLWTPTADDDDYAMPHEFFFRTHSNIFSMHVVCLTKFTLFLPGGH